MIVMKKTVVFILISFVFVIILSFFGDKSIAENEDIILGQSCALSGPAAALGNEYMNGANAYFKEVNDNGGVNGRKIKLITVDDYYEPDYAVKNTLDLIQNRKVFAMFGEVGTPTSKAVLPIIEKYKVPFLMPFSGAALLRKPYNKYIVNMRSSYEHETKAIIEYLVDLKKYRKIAIFYQNDSYGKAGYKGVKKALRSKKINLISEGRYRRNTLLIEKALINILKTKPDAIVLIGAYKPCATFIKEAKKRSSKNISFANISFVGSNALVKELGTKTDNVIISQVVPLDKSGFIYREGYLGAKLFVKAIQNTKEPLTRKSLLDSFATLSADCLGADLPLNIENDKFLGLSKVFITSYRDGKFIQLMEHKE